MAGFEYGGGGGDENLTGTRPFDSDGYLGFDPRLPSQRFDSSQRFDESFRAPEHFNPTFGAGDDPKEEMEDEYKSANGFTYHQADTPPAYGHSFDDDPTAHPTEGLPAYSPSFESDLHSDYGHGGDYTHEHGVNGNGFGANDEDDNLFSSLPSQQTDGPILPPPEEMREEGAALREWKRENAIRLEEKERKEREKLQQIIEEADDYKDGVYVKRKTTMENMKKSNRDKEKVNLVNQENFHKDADKHYWKAVAELIPNELPTIDKGGKKDKKDKKPGIVAIKGPKPGKSTDLTRLRQVLVKLKHNPPAHMKYKPPPPPPAEIKDKEKSAKDGAAPSSEGGSPATPSSTETSAPSPPAVSAAVTA